LLSPTWMSAFTVVVMVGLYIEALVFRAFHDDPPSTYKLFAVRDMLIRLVVEKKIDRDEPHFDAFYENVNTFLRASRAIAGPKGWPIADASGKWLAHHPRPQNTLRPVPTETLPDAMRPAVEELRPALEYLVRNHFGFFVHWDSHRRELIHMQREQAKELLRMMPTDRTCRA
jgi:hypothetical protein